MAISPGFALKSAEIASLISAFVDPSAVKGVSLNGVKYFVQRFDERSIYGGKGSGGLVCVKTNQNILVGIYDEKLRPGAAANIVERLADYLTETGN